MNRVPRLFYKLRQMHLIKTLTFKGLTLGFKVLYIWRNQGVYILPLQSKEKPACIVKAFVTLKIAECYLGERDSSKD